MKKIQSDSSRSGFNRKKEHTSPTRFPKKQFEFIYREKDNLPSSEAFESIIFMKSKKCDNKSSHSTIKTTGKHRKQPVQQLKKAITEIEKHLKDDENRKNKKIEENAKQNILKNTIHNSSHQRREVIDNYNKKSSQRWNKYNKVDFASSDNVKSYKNILSPSKNLKKKEDGLNSKSNKFTKSQQTFRKQIRTKQKRRQKKQNRDPDEYIFLENNFVQINLRQASALEDKMLSSRQFFIEKKLKKNNYQNSNLDNSPRFVDQQTEKIFQQYLLSDDKQSQPTPIDKSVAQENQQIFAQNNILVVQKYIVSKIKLIQKWWRSMLQKKEKKQPKDISQIEKQDLQNCSNEDHQVLQNIELMEQSIIFGERVICTSRLGNNSPIKMIDQFVSTLQDNTGIQIIQSRQTAARKQLETHKTILQSLLFSKRITPQTYSQKKQLIQAKYYNNLEEIQELKSILRKNANKTVEIEKKALDDLKIIQNTDIVINNSLLDQIFGGQFGSESDYQNRLMTIPILPNDSVYNRQKSTGCHYNSQESSNSIYRKRSANQDRYEQDFYQYDKQNQNHGEQYRTFCSENVKVDESLNSNFKELFDQFKLREQAKMQIDKRAAIQMGIIIEEVPEQQKQETVGIDTSLNTIHRFLLSFFKYYIYYYKYDFLRLINMPFGYNIQRRLKTLQGYADDQSYQQDEEGVIYGLDAVITQGIFQQFYQKVYQFGSGPISAARMSNYQFEKVHNRALFDCFNEGLNYFRPYYLINGPPYPWNYSEKALTFYFIAQENIQEVFEKTQFKVLKWASNLCGIIVNKFSNPPTEINTNEPIESLLQTYKNSSHSLLNETREDRLNKCEKIQIIESNLQWTTFEEQNTLNFLKVSDLIFFVLLDQMSEMLIRGDYTENINNKGDQIQKQLKTGLEFFHNISQNSSASEFQIF